ncbi:MAG: hypothetical protein HY644_02740 [Acidobacteria bacterium]|nr:hypothetical protein [Acidobacteriota bacterium]
MIHQFAELGGFYRESEGIGNGEKDRLAQFVQDPAQKFRTRTVLLLVFSGKGFERVKVEDYDNNRKLIYLYRGGPPNGWDATPTTGLQAVRKADEFDEAVRKKLARLARSIADAKDHVDGPSEAEKPALEVLHSKIDTAGSAGISVTEESERLGAKVLAAIKSAHPPESKEAAILSVAWQTTDGNIMRVGDFAAFQQALTRHGQGAASHKKSIEGEVKGRGQCCICGKLNTEVSGLLQVPQFKLYTLDKPGSVSGGFNAIDAWRNFPACRECCDKVDFAGERIKKNLTFDYYSTFKYLFLPLAVRLQPTLAFDLLDRLISARFNKKAAKRLTAAEDELFYVVALEKNFLQVDLLFYQPDPQSFRPALYISGLLPSRFRALFDAKDRVDAHPWLNEPSPKAFVQGQFTFGSVNRVFPHAHGGSNFDDDFMEATRAALELRPFPATRLLQSGMRWVRQDYVGGKTWQYRLADLFRSILFFEELLTLSQQRSNAAMQIDYGKSPQADRVRAVLKNATGKLSTDPAAQAAFLVGACCFRIERLQEFARGSTPFAGKLKGFRLNQADVQRRLFVAAKDKAKAYGEGKVAGLLECAGAALMVAPEQWPLSPDEVSYFFALGHALGPRFASDSNEGEKAQAAKE